MPFTFFLSPIKLEKISGVPIITSWSVFNMFISFILYASESLYLMYFFFSSLSVFLCMLFWFKSLKSEAIMGVNSSLSKSNIRFGFILFILSEVMFFVSFFWGFFCFSIIPPQELGGEWPPIGLIPISPLGVPLLNTIILLSSGILVTWAHSMSLSGQLWDNKSSTLSWEIFLYFPLLFTLILGVVFLSVQFTEYSSLVYSLADSAFGSSFFILTGFHGMHVLVGCCMLLWSLISFAFFYWESWASFECAIWYWHFVDVVWLFLFGFVYIWSLGY